MLKVFSVGTCMGKNNAGVTLIVRPAMSNCAFKLCAALASSRRTNCKKPTNLYKSTTLAGFPLKKQYKYFIGPLHKVIKC